MVDITVVSGERLLLGHWGKCGIHSVQLYDTRTGHVLAEVQLHGKPWRMCRYGRAKAAVALGDLKNVQFIQVKDDTLIAGKLLSVKENVYGITSSGDKLIVSYSSNPWLEVISQQGKVLHQFSNSGTTQNFQSTDWLSSTADGMIYVSDTRTSTVTKLDNRLNLLQTYTSPLLRHPRGITAVSEDQLIVCNHINHSVVLLRPSIGEMSTLLGEKDGIQYPYSLSYSSKDRKIYVARYKTDSVFIYEMK